MGAEQPAVDPGLVCHLARCGYVIVPRRCVSPQGLEEALTADEIETLAPGSFIPRSHSRMLVGAVADAFGVTRAQLVGRIRAREIARPRQFGMYFARIRLGYTTGEIGRIFGDRDRTTVLHAGRVVDHMLADPAQAALATDMLGRIERAFSGAAVPPKLDGISR